MTIKLRKSFLQEKRQNTTSLSSTILHCNVIEIQTLHLTKAKEACPNHTKNFTRESLCASIPPLYPSKLDDE